MSGVLAELRERGFVSQTTDDAGLERLLSSGPVTVYAGFDPTASSLHVGHLLPVVALRHLERAGHRPIAIVGGGTAQVGDPTGKQEMRKFLEGGEIEENLRGIRRQIGRFLDFDGGKSLILDNARWLLSLNYLEFLRDIGRHFSVNRMIAAECFKIRLESESGLSFLEFNYMLLQAYDFLELYRRHGCRLQIGGSDQWGNIVAGIDLIRRVEGKEAYGLTLPLIMTASGQKMGKTVGGSVWLEAERTSPYDFYQYWINCDDRDAGKFLRLFTFLPLEEIRELEKLQGSEIRRAKEVLAFEATKLVHGEGEAANAREAARALFGGSGGPGGGEGGGGGGGSVPTALVALADLEAGIPAANLFADHGLCSSRGEAKRLARQGGLYLNGQAIAEDRTIGKSDLEQGKIQLRVGKKKHLVIEVRS